MRYVGSARMALRLIEVGARVAGKAGGFVTTDQAVFDHGPANNTESIVQKITRETLKAIGCICTSVAVLNPITAVQTLVVLHKEKINLTTITTSVASAIDDHPTCITYFT